VRPCSTASWWRRTRISMYLVVSDRVCSTISGSCRATCRARTGRSRGCVRSFGHPHAPRCVHFPSGDECSEHRPTARSV
jgi:hypothetical protein